MSPAQIARRLSPDGRSWATTEGARKSFVSNRSRDTSPEWALRRELHGSGLRYRVACRPIKALKRTADLVFGPAKLVVFVDGCFWHGCPLHFKLPASHAEYWSAKIARNRARDVEGDQLLADAGWQVVRIWEHEDPAAAAEHIRQLLNNRRSQPGRAGDKIASSAASNARLV